MSAKHSKEYWRDRAKRMETYYNEAAAQRSQALADLDREATEVELLRTVLGSLMKEGAFDISYRDLCWETAATSAHLTSDQIAAVDRAKRHVLAHAQHLDTDELADALGAVPLEDLPPDAQERGRLRTAHASIVGNRDASERRNARRSQGECPWPDGDCTCSTQHHRQEAIDEVDVTVTLADAANVIEQVRDHLLDPDRPLSLGALALLLGSVLPRIEYQAGCEATIYAALHQVVLRHAIATTLETGFAAEDERLDLADQVLDVLRHHIPKVTATMQKEQ